MQSDIFIVKASWEGLSVKYVNLRKQPLIAVNNFIMGVAIVPFEFQDVSAEKFESDWLTDVLKTANQEYLLFTISPCQFQKLVDEKMHYYHQLPIFNTAITDNGILHLAHLLTDEIENPKPLNQQFVLAIATILITHCLQKI
jgi:hypothetical protein